MHDINKPYVRDGGRVFKPIYVPGETYCFYFNNDIPMTDPDMYTYGLCVIDNEGNIVASNFANMRLIPTNPGNFIYSLAFAFAFPSLPDGDYYFELYATKNNQHITKVRSNPILVAHEEAFACSALVKFRHSSDLYNFDYSKVYNFELWAYQIYRLPINQIDMGFEADRVTFRESSNGRKLRNAKSFLDVPIKFESYWFDDEAQNALAVILEHDEVYIDGNRIVEKSTLQIEAKDPISNRTKGTFEAYFEEYHKDYNRLENYGDLIIFGGDDLYLPSQLIDANFI